MDYQLISVSQLDSLWEIQKLYKREIGEVEPESAGKDQLADPVLHSYR